MEDLRKQWDAATSFTGGDVSEKWWSMIEKNYNEDGRVYHNHTYLTRLFKCYEKYSDKLSKPNAVALAIFFHK